MRDLWRRLVNCAVVGGDDPELVLKKRLQLAMALSSVPAVFMWGVMFLPSRLDAAVLPWTYCAATVVMIAVVATTKRYELFRGPHTLLVVAGPAILHFYLGGFAGSGGAMLWSFIGPIAGMMIGSRARWSILLVVALAIASGVYEVTATASPRALTSSQASFFFAFNACGLALFVYRGTHWFVTRLEAERARSERLLLNVLPAPIAVRLKKSPGVIADRFSAATVLFSDLVGFTALSQKLSAPAVVQMLNDVFTRFDLLAEKHGLEKIKTIGDAYMVVGGLPEPCADHAERVARMALEMRDAIAAFSQEKGLDVSMRIGVHSGDVVAGVIGKRKFTYDLWGDTVNTASRMESHGAAGKVQLSAATHALLDGKGFAFTERGTIEVKGKGAMNTYWLDK